MVEFRTVQTDVLIIGGGGAAVRAGIAADDAGAQVAMLVKGQIAHSGLTAMACPSYQAAAAFEEPEDTADIAFEDAVKEGRYLGDENLIRVLVEEATERALEMERYGVKLTKNDDGRIYQVMHPGQSFARNLVIRGCGYGMMVGLRRELLRRPAIQAFEDFVATRLIKDGDRIAGAVAMNLRTGEMVVFEARSVIMATGGYEEIMEFTDTEPGASGDGTAVALHAGVDMVDLEMMLFYPTCLVWPDEIRGTLVQYEGLLGPRYISGRMLNGKGETFLPEIEERYVLPVRDIMMKAMFKEIDEGRGTEHGGVYIDLRDSPRSEAEIFSMLHTLDSLPYTELRDVGIDITKEAIEVKPGTHFCLGGIRINERTESSVPGFFAAGEVAGNVHGANRTSGNALAETQVFGARAGEYAAEYALGTTSPQMDRDAITTEIARVNGFLRKEKNPIRPIEIRNRLKRVMQENMAHNRNHDGMNVALETIRHLRDDELSRVQAVDSPPYMRELQDALEISNMLDVAEAVVESALFRVESRGHHFRTDFPETRDDWLLHTILRETESGLSLDTAPVIRLKDRATVPVS
jgi:succinate dehydrogenase/fumarate reductase flavoprotein subunit